MDTRIIAKECKTCSGLVAEDDEEAVRFFSQSEQRHYVVHADCWRNGSRTQKGGSDARYHSSASPSLSD